MKTFSENGKILADSVNTFQQTEITCIEKK